jgi:hypothetical protein
MVTRRALPADAGFSDGIVGRELKMPQPEQVPKPELERQSRRLARPSLRFLLIALVPAALGVVLMIIGSSWVWAVGIVLVVLAGPPGVVGIALLGAATVARWAARDRPFA